jgi:hypothetical protein
VTALCQEVLPKEVNLSSRHRQVRYSEAIAVQPRGLTPG